MISRTMLYNILYALAAKDGRDQRLFGPYFSRAQDEYERSLVGDALPEIWFELPLLGEPWFDLHVLTAHDDLPAGTLPAGEFPSAYPELYTWFTEEPACRQMALSWDTASGSSDKPAIQLLVRDWNPQITCAFLEKVGRPDAIGAYRAFRDRLPEGWFAAYTGTFPEREGLNLRVECIPDQRIQIAYQNDPQLLEAQLRGVGLANLGDTVIERCLELARTPYPIEFQFDVLPDGMPGPTFSASVRFDAPTSPSSPEAFTVDGPAGELMQRVESWGLADDRWRLLDEVAFCKKAKRGDTAVKLYLFTTFLKLKWHDGQPVDAKTYLIGGMQ